MKKLQFCGLRISIFHSKNPSFLDLSVNALKPKQITRNEPISIEKNQQSITYQSQDSCE